MDRVADGGEEWRLSIRRNLQHLGINWLDPTDKPIDIGEEDKKSREARNQAKKIGDWDTVSDGMKPIRCVDLRMVDVCDFLVVYIDLSVHACGTYEEVFLANRQKKPVLFVIEQGKENTPNWLLAALPHEYFFSSWDELYDYMEMIAYDKTYTDIHGRWYFFDWTGSENEESVREVPVYHPDPSRRIRTLVKSIGWESLSFVIAVLVTFLVLGDLQKASWLTLFLLVVKVPFLYMYERFWHKIRWGKYGTQRY
jgi:uncharacterized membrane protein